MNHFVNLKWGNHYQFSDVLTRFRVFIGEIMSLKLAHHLSLSFIQRKELPHVHMCCLLLKAFLRCDDKSVSSCVSATLLHGEEEAWLLCIF